MTRLFWLLVATILTCFACGSDSPNHERHNNAATIATGGRASSIVAHGGIASIFGPATVPIGGLAWTASSASAGTTSLPGTENKNVETSDAGSSATAPFSGSAGMPVATIAGTAGTAGTGVVAIAGAPNPVSTAGSPSGGTVSTRVYPVETGPSTPLRVLFDSLTGGPKDESLQVAIRLQNRSADEIRLKDIEVVYWGKMDPLKTIACLCDTVVCDASTVGSFRSTHNQANTGFLYAFPGFSLLPGKEVLLAWNCHYTDWSIIDETTHYSYPMLLTPGEEMPRVTVVNKLKQLLIWGILPE
jgi:hypothetical protein